jgi:hypothetical protein
MYQDFAEFTKCTDVDTADLIDFDDAEQIESKSNTQIVKYDNRTAEYYRVLRLRKMDPIMSIDLDESKCFKFYYKWDPYTGNRLEKDSDGPLCFHPDVLIHYFYVSRLNNLWVDPVDDINAGQFEGYYDVAVGAGENIYVPGRGEYPEKYLFRLPIIDCYLTKDHRDMVVTMGPKLTDSEIKEIYALAENLGTNYLNMFGAQRPNLIKMKEYYDQAISIKPKCSIDLSKESTQKIREIYDKLNRQAVDKLKQLI